MSSAMLLVVCGDARRREGFVSTLADAGWSAVLSAPGMSEAASLLRNTPNACVIIDAALEDMPGLKAAQILRNLCPHVKIVFATPENTRDLESQVRALDVFYYYISSADRAELVAAVEDAIGAPRHEKTGRPPKVLIVDDDPDFHCFARAILEPAGYGIVSAYSEREGLGLARREKPDAILLDIIMSSTTDGFEFCREVRRDPKIKHTPILGVSAIEERIGLHCSPDHDPDLFPVDGYLRKPVAPEQLFAELKRLIPAEG
ncbi:MAG: response regulator [Planctomycetota bacterium]|nr:response regulator [Planctomycetota bacterium]